MKPKAAFLLLLPAIACFGLAEAAEARNWRPSLVYVDAANRVAYSYLGSGQGLIVFTLALLTGKGSS